MARCAECKSDFGHVEGCSHALDHMYMQQVLSGQSVTRPAVCHCRSARRHNRTCPFYVKRSYSKWKKGRTREDYPETEQAEALRRNLQSAIDNAVENDGMSADEVTRVIRSLLP